MSFYDFFQNLGIILKQRQLKNKSKVMHFFKLPALLFIFLQTQLYANHTDTMQAVWKIVFPILLLLLLLLISHYVMRQYNRRLKEEVKRNIEELRNKDELLLQQQRMAAMGEMLSMISHQWKQPLGAINTAIMGIKIKIESGKIDLSDPFEQKKFLTYLERKHNSILEYVQYLSSTTDDFRNFFNPNKSKEITHLTSPIENALKIIRPSMEKKGIEITTDFKADTEFIMYPNEITQILLNLLKNSEDNFKEKKIENPKIVIATLLRENQPVIRVYDNGGGIPAEVAKHIFEPYFSTKSDKLGSGLGLYMSKIIMEEHHNGTLSMQNQNKGVTFELRFKIPKNSTNGN
ncbi:MAG TPA: HAMP domain-containing histidine kinase [Sulfurovum sp.]|nr:HAMP domain-containing histidine kinase [Sulfurovum sp.]